MYISHHSFVKDDWSILAHHLKKECRGAAPAIFASNVLKQGWCSDKQFDVMVGMLKRLNKRRIGHEIYYKVTRGGFKKKRASWHPDMDYGLSYSLDEESYSNGYGEY